MERDLVKRLREGLDEGVIELSDIMDAADEIHRLREEVKQAEETSKGFETRLLMLEQKLELTGRY